MSTLPPLHALLVECERLPRELDASLKTRSITSEPTTRARLTSALRASTPDVIVCVEADLGIVSDHLAAQARTDVPIFLLVPRSNIPQYRAGFPPRVCGVTSLDMPVATVGVRIRTSVERQRKANASFVERTSSGQEPEPQRRPTSPPPRPLPPLVSERETRPPREQAARRSTKRSTRISLELPPFDLHKMRLALIDDDLTRADAIGGALRAAGHQVMLVSNTPGRTRFSLLRRFAPAVIVVDESSLGALGGQWLASVRADRHLRHTPLVAARYSELFDETTGAVRLASLTPQLEGWGKAEVQLLTQLLPGTEIEVGRAQIPVGRLLRLLDDHGQPVEVEARWGKRTIRWPLAEKQAGAAQVLTGAQQEEWLEPAAALDWILDGDGPLLVRRKESRGLESEVPILSLVEESYREAPPAISRASSAEPPAPRRDETGGTHFPGARGVEAGVRSPSFETSSFEAPSSTEVTRPIQLRELQGETINEEAPTAADLHPAPAPERQHPNSPMEPFPEPLDSEAPSQEQETLRANLIPEPEDELHAESPSDEAAAAHPESSTAASSQTRPAAPAMPQARTAVGTPSQDTAGNPARAKEALLMERAPAPPRSAPRSGWPWIAAACVLLAPVLWATKLHLDGAFAAEPTRGTPIRKAEAPASHPVAADAAPGHEAPLEQQPAASTSEGSEVPVANAGSSASNPPSNPEQELWTVPENRSLATCEELLSLPRAELEEQPSWKGEALWKRARSELLLGREKSAHRLMCQAVVVSPNGPASVGLASHYLTHRAFDQAERWARFGIERGGRRLRKSQELLADVHCQRGEMSAARSIWLQTMRLRAEDAERLQLVARALTESARQSLRGGDAALAERLLRRAAALDGANAERAARLSSVLAHNGQVAAAEAWARHAASLDENEARVHLSWGDIERAKGNLERARQHYQRVMAESPLGREAESRLLALARSAPSEDG